MIFTCLVLLMSFTGIASEMRDEEGNFTRTFNWKTILGGTFMISFLLGLLFIGNLYYIRSLSEKPDFLMLWLNSFCIFGVVHLYDLFILDYLVVVKWHPKFLKLPNTNYYRSFTPHVKGFIKGIPLGIIGSLLASIICVGMP